MHTYTPTLFIPPPPSFSRWPREQQSSGGDKLGCKVWFHLCIHPLASELAAGNMGERGKEGGTRTAQGWDGHRKDSSSGSSLLRSSHRYHWSSCTGTGCQTEEEGIYLFTQEDLVALLSLLQHSSMLVWNHWYKRQHPQEFLPPHTSWTTMAITSPQYY